MICGPQKYSSFIDLGHSLDEKSQYWPSGTGFSHCLNCSTGSGFFYSSGTFTSGEHTSTHVDAPLHFSENGCSVDKIILSSLIAEAVVVDIADKISESSADYTMKAEDLTEHEQVYGQIQAGKIVCIRTGWAKLYDKGPVDYLGFDEVVQGKYDSSKSILKFPGIGPEAAALLVQRGVVGVGIDTASLDPGSSKDFIAHRILLGAGIYGIENLNSSLDLLPAVGCTLFVMPMKVTGS